MAAAQVVGPRGVGDKFRIKRKRATNTDLEPITGVTMDASPERRAMKQQDWAAKKRIPIIPPAFRSSIPNDVSASMG